MVRISKKITQIYNKLNQEDEKGFLYYFVFPPLYFISILYGIGVRLRFFLYRIGLFKTRKLNCKVISVGNITIGGSGKTPMAIYLAKRLRQKGKKVVILSRGYKGKIKNIGVVSDGENILLGPEDAGDEPYLMAARLKTVPVIVGRDRYKTGLYAIEKFNPDYLILDDGFQHIRLARDIDILLIDSKRGFGNGYLFPLGILREPLNGLKLASLFMVKGERSAFSHQLSAINFSNDCPIISFSYKPQTLINLADGNRLNTDILKGKKVVALSGIADPISFKDTLESLGAVVVKEISYPDHYCYIADDLNCAIDEAKGTDMVIVTEKDGVKLKRLSIKSLAVHALEIDVEIRDKDSEIFFAKAAGL